MQETQEKTLIEYRVTASVADSDKQQFAHVSAQAQNVHKTKSKLFVYV